MLYCWEQEALSFFIAWLLVRSDDIPQFWVLHYGSDTRRTQIYLRLPSFRFFFSKRVVRRSSFLSWKRSCCLTLKSVRSLYSYFTCIMSKEINTVASQWTDKAGCYSQKLCERWWYAWYCGQESQRFCFRIAPACRAGWVWRICCAGSYCWSIYHTKE